MAQPFPGKQAPKEATGITNLSRIHISQHPKSWGKTKSHTDAKGCKSHKTLLWFLCISTPETKGENPLLDSDVPVSKHAE